MNSFLSLCLHCTRECPANDDDSRRIPSTLSLTHVLNSFVTHYTLYIMYIYLCVLIKYHFGDRILIGILLYTILYCTNLKEFILILISLDGSNLCKAREKEIMLCRYIIISLKMCQTG